MDSLTSIKTNLEQEKKIIKEIATLFNTLPKSSSAEKEHIIQGIFSLQQQLKILNNAIPELLNSVTLARKLTETIKEKPKEIIGISYNHQFSHGPESTYVTINKQDKNKFLQELSLSHLSLKKLRKPVKEAEEEKFKKPSFYGKLANKFFFNKSQNLISKGYFNKVGENLRKSNMFILSTTYVSMMFLSVLIALILGIIISFLVFFTIASIYSFLIIIILPLITFAAFYFYPGSEAKSISKKINQELPFVAIHMSAIAGSGIEPSNIFKIIALSKEYPYTRKEIRKLLNQINIYGYDLSTALRNSAKMSSSSKLADLFNGLATTINSGGSLTSFLDKRAETLLLDYKLDREKYTKIAETFMNIYISVVIAAPMILMLLLMLISISGISLGISINVLTVLIIFAIAAINVFFLILLQMKQPGY